MKQILRDVISILFVGIVFGVFILQLKKVGQLTNQLDTERTYHLHQIQELRDSVKIQQVKIEGLKSQLLTTMVHADSLEKKSARIITVIRNIHPEHNTKAEILTKWRKRYGSLQ